MNKPLILNNMNEELKELKENVRTFYKIKCIINDKFYNEELKKYLVASLDGKSTVIVSDTKEVEMEVENIWQVTDRLYDDVFESVTITKNK